MKNYYFLSFGSYIQINLAQKSEGARNFSITEIWTEKTQLTITLKHWIKLGKLKLVIAYILKENPVVYDLYQHQYLSNSTLNFMELIR